MSIWLHLRASGHVEVMPYKKIPKIDELQARVGGYVERLCLDKRMVLWCNEDGLGMKLPRNWLASTVATHYGVPSAHLVGDTLLEVQSPQPLRYRMTRVYLLADFGKGPRVVNAVIYREPKRGMVERAGCWLSVKAANATVPARRWWLVECASAEAARAIIKCPAKAGEPVYEGPHCIGRILASGGAA